MKKLEQSYSCKNAIKYKALYKPRCNKGNPCEICLAKWELSQAINAIMDTPIDLSGYDMAMLFRLRVGINNFYCEMEDRVRRQYRKI